MRDPIANFLIQSFDDEGANTCNEYILQNLYLLDQEYLMQAGGVHGLIQDYQSTTVSLYIDYWWSKVQTITVGLTVIKGVQKKMWLAQNLKIAFSQEPIVQGGCPFHSL